MDMQTEKLPGIRYVAETDQGACALAEILADSIDGLAEDASPHSTEMIAAYALALRHLIRRCKTRPIMPDCPNSQDGTGWKIAMCFAAVSMVISLLSIWLPLC